MNGAFGILSELEYPGRLIGLGTDRTGSAAVIVYAVTGRSPASQARKLVSRDNGIWVQPTDEETIRKGNVELLVYPAVLFGPAGAAVSNGRQTGSVLAALVPGANPAAVLAAALEGWDYEPDAPIFTPRISGCVSGRKAGLSVVRRGAGGETLRNYFELPFVPGSARLVSTYPGPNRDPLASFSGEPIQTEVATDTPGETAEAVYRNLAPRSADRDFRVAVACVFVPAGRSGEFAHSIINRHERT